MGMKYDWGDLAKLYLEDGLTADEIANIKECPKNTVHSALRRHHIEKRSVEVGHNFKNSGSTTVCFCCGICIGPGNYENTPYSAGNKILCGWCYDKLLEQGFIQLNECQRLLANGKVIRVISRVEEL